MHPQSRLASSIAIVLVSAEALAGVPEMELTVSRPARILVGETPELRCQVRNASNRPLEFVLPLDGSWHHRRYPRLSATVEDPEQNARPLRPGGRCGNMNALGRDSLARIDPGKSMSFTMELPVHLAGGLAAPGSFKVKLSYDSRCSDPAGWGALLDGSRPGKLLGPATPSDVIGRLGQVPKTVLTADALVEVQAVSADMLERALVQFHEQDDATEFAFVRQALDARRWRLADVRASEGWISFVVQFAGGWQPPRCPDYVTDGYWFEEGRYLVRRCAAGANLLRLLNDADASTYAIDRPIDAAAAVNNFPPERREALGF
jgi:hypothetical protein